MWILDVNKDWNVSGKADRLSERARNVFFLYIVGKEWEHPGSIFWNSVRLNEKRNYKHSDQVTGMKLPTVN